MFLRSYEVSDRPRKSDQNALAHHVINFYKTLLEIISNI